MKNIRIIGNAIILFVVITINQCVFGKSGWVDEAKQRIHKIRQGDLRIQVIDKQEIPVEKALVHVKQVRHGFRFGTAIQTHRLTEPGIENEKYREMLKRYFNMASPENALKWGPWEGEFNENRFVRFKPEDFKREKTIAGLQWLKENDFYVRGHTLVWPGFARMPMYLSRFKEDSTGLLSIIRAHIVEETHVLKNYIDEWDAVNEPVSNNDVINMFGDQVLVDWFRIARQVIPETFLILNETDQVGGARSKEHSRKVLSQYLQVLLANDTPINGVGVQGHVRWEKRITMPEILAYFDQLQDLGLPISITEFDLRDCSDQELGQYTRDFFIAAFSHPAVTSIQIWGFWEGDIVRPDYAPFLKDWTPRPNGQAYIDLVFGEWWTDKKGDSDKEGLFRTRVFFGNYEITVQLNGKRVVRKVRIPEGNNKNSVVIIL